MHMKTLAMTEKKRMMRKRQKKNKRLRWASMVLKSRRTKRKMMSEKMMIRMERR